MKNNYDKIEYIETKRASPLLKFTVIVLITIFLFIPLAEFINGLDYNYSISYPKYTCIVGLENTLEPLQFKSLPKSN